MRLPAMVNLVLEEVHQQTIAPLGLDPCYANDPHDAAKRLRRQRIADRDQAPVDGGLSRLQLSE